MSKSTVDIKITDAAVAKMLADITAWELGKKGEIMQAVDIALIDLQRNAKLSITMQEAVDTGRLRASIQMEKNNDAMGGMVWTDTHYAPYIEFGTGKGVFVPDGLDEFAIQFKGKGIREVNLPARPFLFPNWEVARKWFTDRVKEILGKP